MKIIFSLILICIVSACRQSSTATATDRKRPEPAHWHAGDMHVHRNCGTDSVVSISDLAAMMEVNDLAVMSVLADMGNGEVLESETDLLKVNGMPAPESSDGRLIQWDAEWHWDATYTQFGRQALGGHLVLLGLPQAEQIWAESPYKVLEWGRERNAVSGFAHMQYLNDSIQDLLNCCIPIDYPVEAALGTIDFISEDVFAAGSPNSGNYFADGAIGAYYRLLNCGFKVSLVAGTDYPCNDYEALGSLLTYVYVPGDEPLTYRKWIEGIARGRTVISRNGHVEFLDLKVDGTHGPGAEIEIESGRELTISVTWSATRKLSGPVEIVSNGKVVARHEATAEVERPFTFSHTQVFDESSWVCARRIGSEGHLVHTSPVYVSVDNRPARADREDAEFFIQWIDNILDKIQPGKEWNKFFPDSYETVRMRYLRARAIYEKIREEAG